MDLSVSPDLDAYICYVIVVLLGAVTAVIQISRRLGDVAGVWTVPQTWLLFFLYLLVPVGLFWLLDRTSALTDTSLFAAVLVGVGYVGIMSGTSQTIRAPGELSIFWTPFLAYADKVSQVVLQRTARNQSRLVDRVTSSIIEDQARYAELEALGLRFSSDPNALRTRLAAVDAGAGARRPNEILEDKARLLVAELASVPDAYYLMMSRSVITPRVYWLYVKGGRSTIVSVFVVVSVIVTFILAFAWLRPDYNRLHADYYLWRLGKTNSTTKDQHRARNMLVGLMRSPTIEAPVTAKLVTALREPGLPIERVDFILQALLETNSKPAGNPTLPTLLVHSLRGSSVDARTRIHDVLKYLAGHCATKFEEGSPWKPSDGDSTTLLEDRVKKWADFWDKSCQSKP